MHHDDLIKKLAPEYKDVGFYFKQFLEKAINNKPKLLDLGCGRQAFADEYYQNALYKIGIDPDQEALNDNVLMDEKYCCTINNIPDNLGQFDLIIAQWILEHLDDPDRDIKKISQLCKTGGNFIFMTTNIYSPVVLISKILPTSLKKKLRKQLFSIDEDDTYPTKYRINSPKKIEYYLTKHGFEKIELRTVGVLTFFAWNKNILRLKILWDKTLGKILPIKTHVVGIYRKI